ncbi:MAG: hypothetical protein IKS21_06780 [Oscillospiraceae bacterium]|nr:hypothetical protein [Oscillospiraceae bacterium]
MTKKGLCSLLVAAFLIVSVFSVFPLKVFAASSVRIGHASISENNSAEGAKGDQTGKEVFTRDWYKDSSKPWVYVIRAKDPVVAEKIAVAMEQACANDKIGYGQSDRTTLFTEAKKKNWKISAITTKCNTDCSALVAVCVNAAGIEVSKTMTTANEKNTLMNTGCFILFESSEYTGKDENLKRGDIILRPKTSTVGGHTVVVLSNGKNTSSGGNNGVQYYPSCSASFTSIVDALNSIGVNSSYSHRSTIASANNITNYSGTASQNTTMLNLLKQGRLINPDANTSTVYFPACASHYTSIVDALNSIGANSSFNYRKTIAAKNNISNYSGTAAQNTQMLVLLKQGKLIKP